MPKIYLSFSATDQTLKRDCSTEIIAGSKSYFFAVFKLSDSWTELDNVKAVFSRGNEVPILMDLTDRDDGAVECVIPWEVMDRAGAFMVGLRGGDLLKTNCVIVYVKQGCAADGIPGRDPTEDWVRRIERSIGNLDDLDTTAKENLVAAINEAMTKGGGEVDPEEIQKIVEEYLADNPPAPGEDGKSAYEIALENGFTGTESDWLASLKGEQGPQGPQGETGNTGATPNIQIGTVETLAAGSEATASMTGTAENPILNLGIPQGPEGSGISVTGATVGQTVKIAAVDDDGVPTAWEPVDLPGDGADLLYESTDTEIRSVLQDFDSKYKRYILYIFGIASANSIWTLRKVPGYSTANLYVTIPTHPYGGHAFFVVDTINNGPILYHKAGATAGGNGSSQWFAALSYPGSTNDNTGFALNADNTTLTYTDLRIKIWGIKA